MEGVQLAVKAYDVEISVPRVPPGVFANVTLCPRGSLRCQTYHYDGVSTVIYFDIVMILQFEVLIEQVSFERECLRYINRSLHRCINSLQVFTIDHLFPGIHYQIRLAPGFLRKDLPVVIDFVTKEDASYFNSKSRSLYDMFMIFITCTRIFDELTNAPV